MPGWADHFHSQGFRRPQVSWLALSVHLRNSSGTSASTVGSLLTWMIRPFRGCRYFVRIEVRVLVSALGDKLTLIFEVG